MSGPDHLAPGVEVESLLYGSAMLRRFGWFYWLMGLGRQLGRIKLDAPSAERIRVAADRGPVVYVLLQRSSADMLALNTALNKRHLPLSVWANGFTHFFWQPVIQAWREVGFRVRHLFEKGRLPAPVNSGWLTEIVVKGKPTALFLAPPSALSRLIFGEDGDPLSALIDAQSRCDQPVQLLPVIVVWNRSPDTQKGMTRRFLEGSHDTPSRLTMLRNVLFRSSEAFVQVGEPVDLMELNRRVKPEGRLRSLRTLLRRYLRRESKLVRGPRLLDYSVMRSLVLDNPPMRRLAAEEAKATGKSEEQVMAQMVRTYNGLAAHFKWWLVLLLSLALRPLWTRVFSGVDVRDEDMERIREATRNGSAVLIPCHKSHVDYLLISWVFYDHNLMVPHVVAGMNLAIWPVSFFLRRAGGFFIKRSFAGDRIFPKVFGRYLRELIRHGYPLEFFIEGGRTRSGKLLKPRFGVLGMVLDAAAVRPSSREVSLLPVSLSYEQVAEENVYARELGGAPKESESVAQLFKARSVFKRRFGRVYLRVAEPISCSEWVDKSETHPRWSARPDDERRRQTQHIGELVMHRIGRVTVLLPTSLLALGLLSQQRPGMSEAVLFERMDRFRRYMRDQGVQEADLFSRYPIARAEALKRFRERGLIHSAQVGEERRWGIPSEKRITLEFYKNQVLHFFAPIGYTVLAIRAGSDEAIDLATLLPRYQRLATLFRAEFTLNPDRSAEDSVTESLAELVRYGALDDASGTYVLDTERISEIYGLFRTFVESYLLVLRYVQSHPGFSTRGLIKQIQSKGTHLLSAGALTHPEALSMVNLKNAVGTFVSDGALVKDGGDGLSVHPEHNQTQIDFLSSMVS